MPVFSACAEVVPFFRICRAPRVGILRVRGGSSQVHATDILMMLYSPRARR